MDSGASNRYGNIQVGDSACVVIGNQNISNAYNIDVVTVDLPPIIRPRYFLPATNSRHRQNTKHGGQACKTQLLPQQKRAKALRTGDRVRRLPRFPIEADGIEPRTESSQSSDVIQTIVKAEGIHSDTYMQRVSAFVSSLRRRNTPLLRNYSYVTDDGVYATNIWQNEAAPSGRDFSVLCAGALSILLGRNMAVTDVIHLISRCRQDQLFPLLTFLIGLALYRYLSTLSVASISQHYLTLEDAYGRSRPISADLCVDFSILRRFLQVHYQQTDSVAGETFVRAGQFHLLLGSRRGRLITAQDWSIPGKIPKGSRVVNSVFVSVNDTRCPRCGTIFMVTKNGEFHCETCQTYHRDYDMMLSHLAPRTNQSRNSTSHATTADSIGAAERSIPKSNVQQISTQDHQNSHLYDVDESYIDAIPSTQHSTIGMKNVDIRIVANLPSRTSSKLPHHLSWLSQVSENLNSFAPAIRSYNQLGPLLEIDEALGDCTTSVTVLAIKTRTSDAQIYGNCDLYIDAQATTAALLLRIELPTIKRDHSKHKAYPLSDFEILHRDHSIELNRITAGNAKQAHAVILFSTMEASALFQHTFLLLRSQISSIYSPKYMAAFAELPGYIRDYKSEFAGVILDENVELALRVYQMKDTQDICLQASEMPSEFDEVPDWMIWVRGTALRARYIEQTDDLVTLDCWSLEYPKGHVFSIRHKPSLNNFGFLQLKFKLHEDADAFAMVMRHLACGAYTDEKYPDLLQLSNR